MSVASDTAFHEINDAHAVPKMGYALLAPPTGSTLLPSRTGTSFGHCCFVVQTCSECILLRVQ